MRVLLDSNCIVALALPAHEHHATTFAEIQRRLGAGHQFITTSHGMTEAYSVLTRLPAPYRLAPADAMATLEGSWSRSEMVALTAAEWWRVLRACAAAGIGGGRVYDRMISECARKGKAAEILTWNTRHFDGSAVPAVSPVAR